MKRIFHRINGNRRNTREKQTRELTELDEEEIRETTEISKEEIEESITILQIGRVPEKDGRRNVEVHGKQHRNN